MIGIEAWWIISFRENNTKYTGDISYRILSADEERLMKNVSKGIGGIINGANSRLDELFDVHRLYLFKECFKQWSDMSNANPHQLH